MKDLILLVADKNMHFALRGALSRPQALDIATIEFKFLEHPGRDGGVRTTGAALLQLEKQAFDHALLVMDFEGSSTNAPKAIMLEEQLDEELKRTWGSAAKAIVIEPELDIWMWGSDNALQQVIGLTNLFRTPRRPILWPGVASNLCEPPRVKITNTPPPSDRCDQTATMTMRLP